MSRLSISVASIVAALTASATIFVSAGCTDAPGSNAGSESASAPPSLSRVTAERTDLLFRYTKGDAVESATTIQEIPAEARGSVQVVDLAAAPEARGSAEFVQVFDLRQAGPDGTYPGRLVPRGDLEKSLRAAAAVPPPAQITIYTAAWCGVCKKAKAFMQENGIAFVEKDIEKDAAAAAELSRKAQAAGVQMGGVPMFDVGGRILGGFDPNTLLAAARPAAAPTGH